MTKQLNLKLIEGGKQDETPPQKSQSEGTSRLEYAVLFTISGILWIAVGYWVWRAVSGS